MICEEINVGAAATAILFGLPVVVIMWTVAYHMIRMVFYGD